MMDQFREIEGVISRVAPQATIGIMKAPAAVSGLTVVLNHGASEPGGELENLVDVFEVMAEFRAPFGKWADAMAAALAVKQELLKKKSYKWTPRNFERLDESEGYAIRLLISVRVTFNP